MIKLLQIGCGAISGSWLSSLTKRDDVKICGLVDLNRDSALKKSAEFNLTCPVFTDVKEAIDSTGPNAAIDNIIPAKRLWLAELCLSNGVHVLSEKPLADDILNAKKIISLSDKYNREFFVMQNRRYNTGMFSFRKAIQSAIIGDIGYLGADFFLGPRFGGFRDEMDSPLLLDMAIHTFDQARFLLGKDPVSVYCKEYNPGWSWYRGNASAVCIFTFEDGSVFNYTGSWCATGINTSWDSGWRASGSKGTAVWNGTDFPEAEISKDPNEAGHPSIRAKLEKIECIPEGHAGCIDDMINSIKNGTRALTDCRDNLKSLAMVFAAIKSSAENREVLIKELTEV